MLKTKQEYNNLEQYTHCLEVQGIPIQSWENTSNIVMNLGRMIGVRTNSGKFNIRFQGARNIWNFINEDTKSLKRLALKKLLKTRYYELKLTLHSTCTTYMFYLFCYRYYYLYFIIICQLSNLFHLIRINYLDNFIFIILVCLLVCLLVYVSLVFFDPNLVIVL